MLLLMSWMLTDPLPVSLAARSTEFGTSHETDEYRLEVRGGSASIGERGVIVVTVSGKGGYTIDESYKHRIKGKRPPKNAQWGQLRLDASDGWISDDGVSFTFELPYRATRIGEYPLAAKLKSRVCLGEECKRVSKTVKTKVYVR